MWIPYISTLSRTIIIAIIHIHSVSVVSVIVIMILSIGIGIITICGVILGLTLIIIHTVHGDIIHHIGTEVGMEAGTAIIMAGMAIMIGMLGIPLGIIMEVMLAAAVIIISQVILTEVDSAHSQVMHLMADAGVIHDIIIVKGLATAVLLTPTGEVL